MCPNRFIQFFFKQCHFKPIYEKQNNSILNLLWIIVQLKIKNKKFEKFMSDIIRNLENIRPPKVSSKSKMTIKLKWRSSLFPSLFLQVWFKLLLKTYKFTYFNN